MLTNRRIIFYFAFFALFTQVNSSLGHGYVASPASRSYACKLGDNVNCGAVQYEPQSVEGSDRFPETGPADGTIAAAGSTAWAPLNVQTPTRWYKHDISSGSLRIDWQFTANHVSRDFRYFITKENWDPSSPLTRDSLELTPFCEFDGNNEKPPMQLTHQCTVPDRTGYHIILAVWDVADTAASFYNAIDVKFSGENNTDDNDNLNPWVSVGLISGAIPLKKGDTLYTRVFDKNGERKALSVSYTATADISGNSAAFELAKLTNAGGVVLAGEKTGDTISAVAGRNDIYVKQDSGIQSVEIGYTPGATTQVYELETFDLASMEKIDLSGGKATLTYRISTTAPMQVSTSIYAHNGELVAEQSGTIDNTTVTRTVVMTNAKAGHHKVITHATSLDGKQTRQVKNDIMLVVVDSGDACSVSDPDAKHNPVFSPSTIYTEGAKVSYQNLVYQARWWTQGTAPDKTDAFKLISHVTLPWDAQKVYVANDTVIFDGASYQAKWWTRGDKPSESPVWLRLNDSPEC